MTPGEIRVATRYTESLRRRVGGVFIVLSVTGTTTLNLMQFAGIRALKTSNVEDGSRTA